MSAWSLAVLALGAVAAVWDFRLRVIPLRLTAPAFALGLLYHLWAGGLASALGAAAAGFGLGLLLMQLGAVGGGDAKWLTATGALLGMHLWFWSLEIAVIAAALIGLAQIARRGRLSFLPADLMAIVRGWRDHGLRPHPDHNLNSPQATTAPFGVAMGIGIACAVLLF